jgi:hypothetical protein
MAAARPAATRARHLLGGGVAEPAEGRGGLAPHLPQAQLGILGGALEQQRLHLAHRLGRGGQLRQRPGRLGADADAVAQRRRDVADEFRLFEPPSARIPARRCAPFDIASRMASGSRASSPWMIFSSATACAEGGTGGWPSAGSGASTSAGQAASVS